MLLIAMHQNKKVILHLSHTVHTLKCTELYFKIKSMDATRYPDLLGSPQYEPVFHTLGFSYKCKIKMKAFILERSCLQYAYALHFKCLTYGRWSTSHHFRMVN